MPDSISAYRQNLVSNRIDIQSLTTEQLQQRTDVPEELRRLSSEELLAQLKSVDQHMRSAQSSVDFGPAAAGLGRRVGAVGTGSVLQTRLDQRPATGPLSGETAFADFKAVFNKQLNEGNWQQGPDTIRLSGKETPALEAEFRTKLDALPNTAERAIYRNAVAFLVGTFEGVKQEKLTVKKLAASLDLAFQEKLAPGGLRLDDQKAAQVPTDIDLSGVENGRQAAAVFSGVLACHLQDVKEWKISAATDGPEYKKWDGDLVRLVKAEENRLRSLIDELFAVLPGGPQAQEFHSLAADLLTKLEGSSYENEKKFPKLLGYLNQAFDQIG